MRERWGWSDGALATPPAVAGPWASCGEPAEPVSLEVDLPHMRAVRRGEPPGPE